MSITEPGVQQLARLDGQCVGIISAFCQPQRILGLKCCLCVCAAGALLIYWTISYHFTSFVSRDLTFFSQIPHQKQFKG